MQHHETESAFLRHAPCLSCGSSDANSVYSDGHEYCFSCGNHVKAGDTVAGEAAAPRRVRVQGLLSGEIRGLRSRKITDETCRHFGYMCGTYQGRSVQIAPYYDADGVMVAQKIRTKDKQFRFVGETEKALPFGSQAFPKSGKMIVVTEGEIDAMAMSQVQGNKWPVVSISSGAGPQIKKYMANHRAYFSNFDRVILMFDMDEPGRKAVRDAAAVLGGNVHIAELPLKDAGEMLVAGRVEELVNAMWRATPYRPEGIVDISTLKEAVMKEPELGLSWPFERLTDLTYGIRTGEIYAFGAGTGIGKTDLFTQTIQHLVSSHGEKCGVFSLEQSVTETATRIVGKLAKRPFHIPDGSWDKADLEKAWDSLNGTGKVFLYDSFGNNDWDIIKEKIEYLHHAEGVKYFFLDHLTALAAWQDDERKALEKIMSEMGGIVKKLNATIFLISHLATPEGKPHEEGGRVMIRHFKGSRSIGFWCHYIFGLERDQQSDSPAVRMTTTFRVLKDRYTGRATGELFYIGYDHETGMLYETVSPLEGARAGFVDETPSGEPEGDF